MQTDPKTLRLYVAVVEQGSISEGALACHLALAAASRRIAALEARARTALLLRHARGVQPTPAGHALLLHARSVLAALDRMQAELDDFRAGVKGLVAVSANASAIAQFLPAELGTFLKLHPGLRIDLHERSSADAAKAVQQGLADLAIFESGTPAVGLECLPYRHDRLCAVLAASHPLARRKRLSAAEVLGQPQIALRAGTALHQLLERQARACGVALQVRMQVASFDAVCRMVEQGIGIGVLPLDAVAPQRQALRIRCVPLDAAWAQREHLLGVRSLAQLPVAAAQLLRHLVPAAAVA